MSYEVGIFETAKIDLAQTQRAAAQRCRRWGYKDAEAFGGRKRQCQARNGYGNCLRWFVTLTYQCTGKD